MFEYEPTEADYMNLLCNHPDHHERKFRALLNSRKENKNVKKRGPSSTHEKWMFITISPDEKKISPEHFVRRCHDFFKSVMFEDVRGYSFEQRSEDPNNIHGIHCHALVLRKRPWSYVVDRLGKVFADCVRYAKPDCEKGNPLYVEGVPEVDVEEVMRYVSGRKDTVVKSAKAKVDLLFRKSLNLANLYAHGGKSCSAPNASLQPKVKLILKKPCKLQGDL